MSPSCKHWSRDAIAEPMNVLVACGPYTPSDSLTFDPLLDLISIIVKDRPDVCLLVCFFIDVLQNILLELLDIVITFLFLTSLFQLGPFVDSKHEQIEVRLKEFVSLSEKGKPLS